MTFGWRASASTIMRAFLVDWRMRSATVGSRPFRIQHSSGCRMVPSRPRSARIGAATAGSRVSANPPIRSEKPDRYLVAEYSTTSAPCRKGCWNTGPSSVLSTITSGRSARTAAHWAACRRSVIVSVGLAGVSTSTTPTSGVSRSARSIPAASPARTGTPRTPHGSSTFWTNFCVPP